MPFNTIIRFIKIYNKYKGAVFVNKVKIKGYDNSTLVGYYWEDVSNPKGVVQIIHGMQEHAKRYDNFARNGKILEIRQKILDK